MTEANHTNGSISHNEHDGPVASVVLFIFCSCALGALVRQVVESIPIKLPYTVLLLLLGVLFGLLSKSVPSVHQYTSIVETDPHIILHTFLPVLIFESAFAMEVHTFKKTFFQVLLLAVPGLALSSFLICIMARYLFTYEWSWTIGMMFGSILSATDPVAVVAILREVGASKQLSMVIEGESLLNDGAAIVFFNIFLTLCTSEVGLSGSEMVLTFLRVAVGGPAFGLVMAKITLFWLSRIFNDCLSEITITLASTYLTYYIGEQFLGVSGVLAVVVLGVVMSGKKTSISPEVEAFLHRFWETLAYLANTLIFILVGVVISEKAIFRIHGIDWFYMFALYFGLQVIRGLVIALFSPILRRIGYGMTWQEGIIMTWGGLRGAVGLALGLLVWEQELLELENVRLKVLIHVSGIVFLTLLINATTVPHVLKILGMNDVSPAKRMAMASALRYLEDLRQKTFNMLRTDRFLADADWDLVEKSCQIHDPYKITDEDIVLEESMDIRPNAICPDCDACLPSQPTHKELREMTNEAILRFLKAEKLSYWRQFVQGMLSREAVRKLQECTEVAADKKGKFIEVDEIKKLWEVPEYLLKIKRYLKSVIRFVPVKVYNYKFLKALYHITTTKAFHCFIYSVIVLDSINSSLSVVALYKIDWLKYRHIMGAINVVFITIYFMEVLIKLICQRCFYFKVVGQVLGLIVVVQGIVDAVLQFSLDPYTEDGSPNTVYRNVLVIMISIRSIRLLRLIEPLLPTLLLLVKTRISLHLSNGYDLGRGFVSGEEEVRKLIDHMVDNRDIAKQLKHHCDASKLDVIRCLGLLQKNHPDIALSVKTRQAIRSVLNNLRDGINDLLEDGVLIETEREKLRKMIEVQMKKLLTAPPSMPLPPPEKLLNNVTWLHNDEKLVDYFKNCAQLVSYDYGDVILKEGDPSQGIYIIVSGLVRLETSHNRTRSSTSMTATETKLMDFLTTGNIIGEMGFLTHRTRMASVKCETAVQLLLISSDDMEKAFEEFVETEPSLEYRLWKVCATRLAIGILMEQPDYQGWTKEKIKLRLENAYLVSGDENDTFTIDSGMADILLIHGEAHNTFTREPFTGPCYIPLTVLKLNLHTNRIAKPVILIIPSEMGIGIPAERRQSFHDVSNDHSDYLAAKLCLRHASVHRRESAIQGLNPVDKRALSQRHSVAQFFSRKPSQADDFGRRQSITINVSNHNIGTSAPLGKRMSTPACIETHNRERLLSTGSDNAFKSPEHGRTSLSDIPGNNNQPTDTIIVPVPSRLASRRGSAVSHNTLPTIPQEESEADSASFKHNPDLTKDDHELDKNTSNLIDSESPQHLKPNHGRGLLKFDSNSQSSQLLFQRLRTCDMDAANSDSDSIREYDHPNNNSSSVEDNEMADANSNDITKTNLARAKGNYDPGEDYYNSWRIGGRKLSRFFSDTDRDDVISCSSTDSTLNSEPDDTEDEMQNEVHINLAAEDDDGKTPTQARTSCSSILDDASMLKYANALMNNLNSADSNLSQRTRKTAMEAEAGSFILQNIEPDEKKDEDQALEDQRINEASVGVDLPPDLPTSSSGASLEAEDVQVHFVDETKDANTEEEESQPKDDAKDKDEEEIPGTVGLN